jgi:hypothetical protein
MNREGTGTRGFRLRGWTLFVAAALWVAAVGSGLRVLITYQSTPGPQADAVQAWPADSKLLRTSGRPTLVVLAHPHCTCTRASLSELNVIMQRFNGGLTAYVLFMLPQDMPDGWEQTDTWRRAKEIPGVVALVDRNGSEAKRFRGYTSGQTLVYDGGGRLLYNGGLTAARGHEGDNLGRRAVIALLSGESRGPLVHNVFGCLLFGDDENSRRVTGDGL